MTILRAIDEAEDAVEVAEANLKVLKGVVKSLKSILGQAKCKLWYLHIPAEGVPCWVGDYDSVLKCEIREEDSKKIRVVYGYNEADELPFHAFGNKWKLAVPVDLELRLTSREITL